MHYGKMLRIALWASAILLVHANDADDCDFYRREWNIFKRNFSKLYKNLAEERFRFDVFMRNHKKVTHHNLHRSNKTVSYTLGINEFSDMTSEEFHAKMGSWGEDGKSEVDVEKEIMGRLPLKSISIPKYPNRKPSSPEPGWLEHFFHQPGVFTEEYCDWRERGAVTKVKWQQPCGGCWAFAAVGAMEAQHFLLTGQLVDLSAQNLIDCTTDLGNKGCDGGWPFLAYTYMTNKGIQAEATYPFEGKKGECRFDESKVAAKAMGYISINQDEDAMKQAVYTEGPITISLNAKDLQDYQSGIIDDMDCDGSGVNHAMLIVGYGVYKSIIHGNKEYWILKNSWGPHWGEDGYVRFARNKNTCNIRKFARMPKRYKP